MPQGKPEVISVLNGGLRNELTAINQYIVHAEMCANWGYDRLHDLSQKRAIVEMGHAEKLIEHILYLEGIPNVGTLGDINIGENVPEQMSSDRKLEVEGIEDLNKGIAICVAQADNGSRELLESILEDEEDHLDVLEAQIAQIAQMGVQQYLAMQIVQK